MKARFRHPRFKQTKSLVVSSPSQVVEAKPEITAVEIESALQESSIAEVAQGGAGGPPHPACTGGDMSIDGKKKALQKTKMAMDKKKRRR